MATREEWIGRTGQEWARRSDALDALLGPAGQAGLDALQAKPGMRILDLGCGAAASTATLARAVGSGGKVTGIDVSPDLVKLARDRLNGVANAAVIEADAQEHDFPSGGFDALFSRFGSMFFDDPPRAFANLHRALAADAPMVVVAWRDVGRNQWASVPMTFVAQALPGTPLMGAPGPGPFAWADPATFRPLLEGAGFRDVQERAFDFAAEISHGDDEEPLERAVSFMVRIGPLASRLKDKSETAVEEAKAFLRHRLSRYVRDGTLRLQASAWIIQARA